MKGQILLFFLALSFTSIYAQVPKGINYQAVVRDNNGTVLSSEIVGVQFMLRQGTANGNSVYAETWNTTTNSNGVVDFIIGNGTTNDNFSDINWSSGPYFLEVLIDVNGGVNYISMGSTQLLSVPYAMHSDTAISVLNETQTLSDVLSNDNSANNLLIKDLSNPVNPQDAATKTYVDDLVSQLEDKIRDLQNENPVQIGDFRHGGVVFWIDPNDSNHGMVCAISHFIKLPYYFPWFDYESDFSSGTSMDFGFGEQNTQNIISVSNNSLAKEIAALEIEGYTDWFMPSLNENLEIYAHKNTINNTASIYGGSILEDEDRCFTSSYAAFHPSHLGSVYFVDFIDGSYGILSANGHAYYDKIIPVRRF